MYNVSGTFPLAKDGVVEKTVCFNHGPPNANTWCLMHASVGVVRCEGFFLFRLSDSGGCAAGYCAAHSGVAA
jgi:hypothetical protein